ncbi:hypothetical protein VOLCADRAFT_103030 [Volvox carteri f. nagariensis]|uniref:3-oxo-5-alpha-steroid 4-dehydrogenase C-terminal domain-containing protein n=1 Tax=Volvox carteri f. nagariensis TaxID=3068 RepID=D8TJG8_VOLCA|nr:uncharacterized protein VOLCADRAFT_103030 [Volvox carteri f. nagariensis]EFJ52371.1 hypothetical protein VOLCADRAFT_103030 [Volvox carteri f. nagariensis]|eukprot:XP_002946444.1 hypothetical protein VOLCADRAFT_103030 [Volvox carteri f. nagariensis]
MSASLHDVAFLLADSFLNVLPQLLRAYWILASASVFVTILPIPVPRAFKAAVKVAAARGKLWYDRPDARALGILKDVSVPQQFFEHFYLIGALANTVLLQVYIFVCCEDQNGSTLKRDSLLALLLFELHVLRRYFESNYVMHYPESARMHLLAYLYGLSYYVAVPLTLLPTAVLNMDALRSAWDLAVGAGKEHWQLVDKRLWEAVATPHPGLPRLIAGVALFLFASGLQYWSHAVLGRLSREGGKRVQEAQMADTLFPPRAGNSTGAGPADQRTGTAGGAGAAGVEQVDQNPDGSLAAPKLTDVYSIPRGGPFELVSCPHYLGEILIYVALALVTRGSVGTLLIAAWVLLNLVLAADATQRWYHHHFPDYPRRRAALIPLLF